MKVFGLNSDVNANLKFNLGQWKKTSGLSPEDRIHFPWRKSCILQWWGKGSRRNENPARSEATYSQTYLTVWSLSKVRARPPQETQDGNSAGGGRARGEVGRSCCGRRRGMALRGRGLACPWGKSSHLLRSCLWQQLDARWCPRAATRLFVRHVLRALLQQPSVPSRAWEERHQGGRWERGRRWSCFEPSSCFLSYPYVMLLEEQLFWTQIPVRWYSGFLFFFFSSFFWSRIVCQWIGRTVFNSSFMSNVETSRFDRIFGQKMSVTRCLERECTEGFLNGVVRRKTTGCRTVTVSWLGKKTKVV